MGRPQGIVGLMVELVRVRGVPRPRRRWLAGCAALVAVAAVAARPSPSPRAMSEAEQRWTAAPADTRVAFADGAVVATETGWVVAWIRWTRGETPALQVASLDRGGALRGEVRTLTGRTSFARYPSLARLGARVGVAWTATDRGDQTFSPRPWVAVVDASAAVVVPARPIAGGDEEGYRATIASDGEGWGVGWSRFSESRRGFALARLNPDASPRGAITHVDASDSFLGSTLAWTGEAWVGALTLHDYERDRSGLRLHWIDRGGRVIGSQRFAPSRGELGEIEATARGGAVWLTWAEDGGFNVRHDPRLARLEGRRAVHGPVALGPRRSASLTALACAATTCLASWVGVPEEGDAPASLHVQVLDHDGAALGAARRVGPAAPIARLGAIGLARSLDEREVLALWTVRDGDDLRLMRVRLDAEGAPQGEPALLPLP